MDAAGVSGAGVTGAAAAALHRAGMKSVQIPAGKTGTEGIAEASVCKAGIPIPADQPAVKTVINVQSRVIFVP